MFIIINITYFIYSSRLFLLLLTFVIFSIIAYHYYIFVYLF